MKEGKQIKSLSYFFPATLPFPHLLVAEARHCVYIFFLDHKSSQVGCITGEKDDSKEGPDKHHDLAGGAPRILHRHRVVEHQSPKQPYRLPNGELGASGTYRVGYTNQTVTILVEI